ncbi:S1 RNA-binding domain-containing protein [Eisenbergiella tayi]|uniref:CvfB family protein n=1 Tax=Eisenbergiella tayi TaxID=1432052 RepID=UPI0004715561|nr:S1-like domain-containing RNA-binding protein [Eisenbergiella tayi]
MNMHIELGKMQELMVVKKVDFGVYLAPEDNQEEKVLLPGKQVPEGCETGDFVKVFIYRDSKDRLIATRKEPKLSLGEVAVLTVAQTGKFGAFLDWGLEKDLFLPFKEQTARVQEGDSFPVVLYVDKSGRLCASMKIYHYLQTDSPYKKDDQVSGHLYEISHQFGAFVAVDDRYSALIPPREMFGELRVGELIQARVIAVHEDGKLDLSIRDKSYRIIETDAVKVMELIESFDGVLPFNDKASPEVIKRETQMSKNEFKRAVGHLLKNGRIEITEKSIRKIQ